MGVPKSSDEEGADGPADAVSALNLRAVLVASLSRRIGDDGDTAETATPVVATSTTTAAIEDPDDIDYFRIELPEAGSLRVETTTGFGDLRGTLISESGELIAEDDDGGEGYNFLIEAELEAGVYFVKVSEHDKNRGGALTTMRWWFPSTPQARRTITATGRRVRRMRRCRRPPSVNSKILPTPMPSVLRLQNGA